MSLLRRALPLIDEAIELLSIEIRDTQQIDIAIAQRIAALGLPLESGTGTPPRSVQQLEIAVDALDKDVLAARQSLPKADPLPRFCVLGGRHVRC